ncbi:MAG: VOC family protein [Oscillospiraceae bacterium]
MFAFSHTNFNVADLERSTAFYGAALNLKEVRRKVAEDGSYVIVFLGDEITDYRLELTWLRDWEKDCYDLGDNELHLAFVTDDIDSARAKHREMGCICFENPKMGIYFIEDPDGYWLEIVPQR